MIEIDNLTKTFRDKKRGKFKAVDGVGFRCEPGRIYGLLGPNGAGKTTALRMISTAIRPTEGGGRVAGFDLLKHPEKVRASIGFLSSNTGLYGRLTPREILRFFGELFHMSRTTIAGRTEELADLLKMREFLDSPCDKLSLGTKQKVNIARSIVHSPPVVILDEPTTGLDVLSSRAIVQFIRDCRDEGKTVLFSTHVMSDVARLCDEIGIIHRGRLCFDGPIAELRRLHGDDLEDAFVHVIGAETE